MSVSCAICATASATEAALCPQCIARLGAPESLLPRHIEVRTSAAPTTGWLIDPFGATHALSGANFGIGRLDSCRIILAHGSVSREHATLSYHGGRSFSVRDRGSLNGTFVDRVPVTAPGSQLKERSMLSVGDVSFYFLSRLARKPTGRGAPIATFDVRRKRQFQCRLVNPDRPEQQVWLLANDAGPSDGRVRAGTLRLADDVSCTDRDASLARLPFQLLEQLCNRRLRAHRSAARGAYAVRSDELVKLLPFPGRYPGTDNVRSLVRRVRKQLKGHGITGLLQHEINQGYFIGWQIRQ